MSKFQTIQEHIISMNDDINRVKDMLVGMMDVRSIQDVQVPLSDFLQPLMQNIKQSGIPLFGNPVRMHYYAPQAKCRELRPNQRWAAQSLSRLSTLARLMGYLVCILTLLQTD